MGFLHRLLNLEWLVALAAAPFLTFPTVRPRWTVVALVVLVVWWMLRWALQREPWPLTPFNGALLLFVLMLLVGIKVSTIPELTLPKAAGLILGFVVFRAVTLAVTRHGLLAVALALFCLIGLGILLIGLLATDWSPKVLALAAVAERIPRIISQLPESQAEGVSPNQLAGVLAFYAPLSLALLGGVRWRRAHPLLVFPASLGGLAFILFTVGGLLLTQSRSGWIGGAVGVLGLLTLAGLSAPRRWEQILGMALPLLAVGIITALVLHIGPERMGELLNGGETGGIEKVVGIINMAGRVEIWDRALYAIRDFPFTGCGLGTFRLVARILYPLDPSRVFPDRDISHAHNIFLQTALDLGIPGLIAYLALLVIAGAICWRVARRGDPLARPMAIGLASGLLALHAYGMTDALALGSKPAVIFWFALGLVAALPRAREPVPSEARDVPSAFRASQ